MGLLTTLIKAFKYVYQYIVIWGYKLKIKIWKWKGTITGTNAKKIEAVLDSATHIKSSQVKALLKSELNSQLAYILGQLDKPELGFKILEKVFNTVLAIALAKYILIDWYNRYGEYANQTDLNGALPPDIAFDNLVDLTEMLIVFGQFCESDEFMELFYEGLSDAIREILERQLVGGLAITSALQYGSQPADMDDISEACEYRFVKDKCLDYELLLSGAYNSTGAVIKAKGRGRVLEQMTSGIHNDLQYQNMKLWEVISYPADLISDQVRAIYKNLLIDIGDDLDSAINKLKTQVINAYSVLTAMIQDIEDYSDAEWQALKPKTYNSYEKQINRYVEKINLIYEMDVLQTAQNWDDGIEKAQQILTDLMSVHNTERAKIMNKLIASEQFIYGVVMQSVEGGKNNIVSVRNGGNLTDYDVFKNRLLE